MERTTCEAEKKLFRQRMEAGNVFSQDVKLKIHDAPDLEGVKVGVFESVGDDADLETVGGRLANGETHTIDGHGTFIDGEVSSAGKFGVKIVGESEDVASIGIGNLRAARRAINVSLHDVAIKTSIYFHGAFHVHLIALFPEPEVGAFERLVHGSDGVGVALDFHDGEADAIVRHALVNFQLRGEGAAQGEVFIGGFRSHGDDLCGAFNNS